MQASSGVPPQAIIFDHVLSFFRSRTVQVFAELRVADAIHAGEDPGVNDRFLRAAASIGLLNSGPEGGLTLTPAGELLRSGIPGSMRDFATVILSGGHYGAWGNAAYSAQTEKIAFDYTYGEDIWSYFTETAPDEGRVFNDAMRNFSETILPRVLEAYEFPASGTVVDVGGGTGAVLAAILHQYPDLQGTVMDLEFSREGAEEYLASQDLRDRCSFVGGSFFEAVPGGADLYLMKFILHDWSDAKAGAILDTVHAAMPPHAKLVILEIVVPEDDSLAGMQRMMDLNMMVMCGGKERTAEQWRDLLAAHGFRLDRIVPTASPTSVIEASRV